MLPSSNQLTPIQQLDGFDEIAEFFPPLLPNIFFNWNIGSRGRHPVSTGWKQDIHKGSVLSSQHALHSADSKCPVMTPTMLLSSLFPKSKSLLVCPLSRLPENTFLVCPVFLAFQHLSCSSSVHGFKQPLMELNSVGQLKGTVFLDAGQLAWLFTSFYTYMTRYPDDVYRFCYFLPRFCHTTYCLLTKPYAVTLRVGAADILYCSSAIYKKVNGLVDKSRSLLDAFFISINSTWKTVLF